jgi:dolichol-phosphate mannosyltransferase
MLYVMLPAFNEEAALPLLLDRFQETLPSITSDWRIVVVDDGSSDDTVRVAEAYAAKMPLDLVRHTVNQGLGAAMKTGFAHIADRAGPDDLVCTMDADNTHDPSTVGAMKDAIEDGHDVVIASRYAPGGEEVGLNAFRKVLSRGASYLVSSFFPVTGARDYSCGFRLYRASRIQAAFSRYGEDFITESSFVCMAEILVKIAYLPSRVGEVGLVLRYDMKEGESKMKYAKTIIRYLKFLTREKMGGLRRADPGSQYDGALMRPVADR